MVHLQLEIGFPPTIYKFWVVVVNNCLNRKAKGEEEERMELKLKLVQYAALWWFMTISNESGRTHTWGSKVGTKAKEQRNS